MRRFVNTAFILTVVSGLWACANNSNPDNTHPLESLSAIDSLTVLIHFEPSGVPVTYEKLEHDVLGALERAGVVASSSSPPYLHVRVYCRCGEPTMSDPDTTSGSPTSWHFGMWVDQSADYTSVWGPMPDICPPGPLLWSTGGSGLIGDRKLSDFIQESLSEFVEDYRAASPNR